MNKLSILALNLSFQYKQVLLKTHHKQQPNSVLFCNIFFFGEICRIVTFMNCTITESNPKAVVADENLHHWQHLESPRKHILGYMNKDVSKKAKVSKEEFPLQCELHHPIYGRGPGPKGEGKLSISILPLLLDCGCGGTGCRQEALPT